MPGNPVPYWTYKQPSKGNKMTAKTMPWTIREMSKGETRRINTGHSHEWNCSVRRDCGSGTATSANGAEFIAARHSASHTETELASTGYVVRFNWAAAAAARLANDVAGNGHTSS